MHSTDLAQSVLDRIAAEFDVAMLGVQIVGLDHIVAVAVSRGGSNFQLSAQVGSRFPALISATGRCVAAFGGYADAQLEARFKTLRWDDPPAYAEWQQQVAQTRATGFGVDDGNYISGVTVVAVPIWKLPGRPSHGLVAIGIGAAIKRIGLDRLGPALLDGARSISNQLGPG